MGSSLLYDVIEGTLTAVLVAVLFWLGRRVRERVRKARMAEALNIR